MSETIEYNRNRWYAARVKYRSEKKLKSFLEKERDDIRFFIPFKKVFIQCFEKKIQVEKPVIPCLVFINTDYHTALALPELSGLSVSYIKNLSTNHIRVIPEKQMQDFMRVLDLSEKGSILLSENLKRGDKVRVIKGVFAGVEGELVRIKGHKRVVVNLEGVCSLATTYIPLEYLELIG